MNHSDSNVQSVDDKMEYDGLSDILACAGMRVCEHSEMPDSETSISTERNSPNRLDIPAMSSNL